MRRATSTGMLHWMLALLILLALTGNAAPQSLTVQTAKGKIASGVAHGIWNKADGTVWTWGSNGYGQLGDGTTADRSVPAIAFGLSGIVQVAAGDNHSLALGGDGRVWAWGNNLKGQLGDASNVNRALPVAVSLLSGIVSISARGDHSLALRSDGTVWSWGDNLVGQVGDGTTQHRNVPVPVAVPTNIVAVAAGYTHSLALKSDGTVWAWGYNVSGQLGIGTSIIQSTTPVAVVNLANVTSIAAGSFNSLALKNDGTVWQWGSLLGSDARSSTPVQVAALTSIVALGGARGSALAVRSDGTVWGWGSNERSELGSFPGIKTTVPVQIQGVSNAAAVAGGGYTLSLSSQVYNGGIVGAHFYALLADGSLRTWGYNAFGELGNGSTSFSSIPLPIATPGNVTAVATGREHSVALTGDDSIWTWGSNGNGQLGDGTSSDRPVPVRISLSAVTAVAAGVAHTMAVKRDGTLWAWGWGGEGQLGDGGTFTRTTPVQVTTLSGVVAAAAGYGHSMAMKSDGTVWEWGSSRFTPFDVGPGTIIPTPVQTQGLSGIKSIAAGSYHRLAVAGDGTLWAWGGNNWGALGDMLGSRSTPSVVAGSGDAIAAAGGYGHTVVLKRDGTVWTCGYNATGQLGDGTTTNRSALQQVLGLTQVVAIAAGSAHSIAVKADGSVWAWGALKRDSSVFALGHNLGLKPTQVAPAFFQTASSTGAAGHALMLDNIGRVWSWGDNSNGQLGMGSIPLLQSAAPSPVYDAGPAALDSVQVVEFANPNIGAGHFFLTADANEAASIDRGAAGAGWVRTGRGFRAWRDAATAPAGAKGVCRFYAAGPNSHFFTGDAAECASLKAQNPTNDAALGWRFESIDFYAVTPVNGACSGGYQPVYRAYNNRFGQNDSNHRMSSSYVDQLRSLAYLGYKDEGITFCSPIASIPGGDLHAYHVFPGAELQSGQAMRVDYVFANNGPGQANGARASALVPSGADWQLACSATNGAACPSLAPAQLPGGFVLQQLPAGGVVTLTLNAHAPSVTGSQAAQMRFGNTLQPQDGAPDVFPDNNISNVSTSFVKNSVACSYGLAVGDLAFPSDGGTTIVTVATNPGCPVSTQSDSPWLNASATSAEITIVAAPNAGADSRAAKLTVAGQLVEVIQAGRPSPPPAACEIWLRPNLALLAYNVTASNLAVSASNRSCTWTAKADQPWINLTAGASGTGKGAVSYRVEPNTTGVLREGTIAINESKFVVKQHPVGDDTSGSGSGEGGGGDSGGDGGAGSSGGDSG